MNFKDNESPTKLRGGYYTPDPIAEFLARWVLTKKPKLILEPSCGDGAFVRALNKKHKYSISFIGIEFLKEEADKAREFSLYNKHLNAEILNADFLEWSLVKLKSEDRFDAVLGNPPYIRYQYLSTQDQKLSEELFKSYDLKFTKHTNAWVPFVIASIGLLAPGGRFAMVIPSELLHVLHAGSLRGYLLSECSRILMIDPNELLFDDALQGTILLMVEKKKFSKQKSEGVAVVSAPNNDFLTHDPDEIFNQASYVSGDVLNGKWMKVLLDLDELNAFERVRKLPLIKKFSEVASVDVGIVTGANDFFLVDNATLSKFQLKEFAKPMFGRSGHCPGIIYSKVVHNKNAKKGMPTNFISIGKVEFKDLPKGAQEYVLEGEKASLHTRFKCRIRKPWYSVPSVYATNLGMLKRAHNYPRLILNEAQAFTTDTAYRIALKGELNPSAFVYGFINSLTALTAELEGRHYGGGVLELVPSEIEKLLIPVVDIPNLNIAELDTKIIENHDSTILLANQDTIVLSAAGVSDKDIKSIQQALSRIRSRRQRLLTEPSLIEKNNND